VDEEAITDPDPAQLVQRLARAKAAAVCNSHITPGDSDVMAVLGCDSVLAFEGEVFGKPADADEAIARWRRMAGRWGELHTGHCLLAPTAELWHITTVTTRVQFAALSDAEIDVYVVSRCSVPVGLRLKVAAEPWWSASRVVFPM
jgi:septum formation protein